MKLQFIAKVIGHEVVQAEKPKSEADSMKVKLAVRPAKTAFGKSGTATIQMPFDIARKDLPLLSVFLITMEESQLAFEALEDEDALRPRKDPGQQEIGLPRADSPIAAPPSGLGESLAREATRAGRITPIGGARRRRAGRAGASVETPN